MTDEEREAVERLAAVANGTREHEYFHESEEGDETDDRLRAEYAASLRRDGLEPNAADLAEIEALTRRYAGWKR